MGHHDEYEMLIQYSEMTTFDFNSEEFQKVRKDYMDCKNVVTGFAEGVVALFKRLRPGRSY